jgi:hypothetical protein
MADHGQSGPGVPGADDHEGSHGVFTNAYSEMLIALFLVILVFLMVMDAMALAERRKATQSPFQGSPAAADNAMPVQRVDDPMPVETQEVQGPARLRQALQRTFPNSDIVISSLEGTMEVTVPEDTMFEPGTAQMKPIGPMLDNLMTMLLGRGVGRVVLTAFFCSPAQIDYAQEARHGQELVEALAARGVSYDTLFVGIWRCNADRIILQFKIIGEEET